MTLRLVDSEDGSLWHEVQIERSLVENARPFAAKAGRTVEEHLVHCLETAAADRAQDAPAATLATPEPVSLARARLNVTYAVGLSKKADLELRAFCLRHNIRPEHVLAGFCDGWLDGHALTDPLNAEGAIEDAKRRERVKSARERRQQKEGK